MVEEALVEQLQEMRANQVMLRTLLPRGWTIGKLCDLVIDGFPPGVARDVQEEIEYTVLKPEWIFQRRSERIALDLTAAVIALTTIIADATTINAQLADALEQFTAYVSSSLTPHTGKTPVGPGKTNPPPSKSKSGISA